MTHNEAQQYIGKVVECQYPRSSVWIKMTIKDVKESYGRRRYLVTPLEGTGEMWVEHYKND